METHTFPSCLAKVIGVIAEVMEIAAADIGPNDNLYRDWGVDSLATVAIFVELKRSCGTPEPSTEDEYQRLSTPTLLAEYVLQGVNAR